MTELKGLKRNTLADRDVITTDLRQLSFNAWIAAQGGLFSRLSRLSATPATQGECSKCSTVEHPSQPELGVDHD